MKKIKIIFAVLVCMAVLAGCGAEKTVVRNVSWGTTKEEVKAAESSEPTADNGERLAFEITDFEGFEGVTVYISYSFKNDKLTGVAVYFESGAATREQSSAFVDKMTEKYGEPEIKKQLNASTYSWNTKNSTILFVPEYYISFKQK